MYNVWAVCKIYHSPVRDLGDPCFYHGVPLLGMVTWSVATSNQPTGPTENIRGPTYLFDKYPLCTEIFSFFYLYRIDFKALAHRD